MDFNDKSKDELIIELQGLIKNYDSLKNTHDLLVLDCKKKDAILASEEHFHSVFESSAMSTWFVDLTGKILMANNAVQQLFGYTNEELIKLTFNDITHPDDLLIGSSYLSSLLANEIETASFEKRYIRKSGQIIYALTTVSLIKKDNESQFIITQINDITIRKEIELELKASKEKYSKIFDRAPVLISLTDFKTGIYSDVNSYALSFSGFSHEEVIGKKSTEIGWISSENRDLLANTLIEKGRIDSLEMEFKTKSGETVYGLVNGEKIILNNNVYLLTITTDITERKKVELLLKEKTEEIETQTEEYLKINEELQQINQELITAKEKAEESEKKLKLIFDTMTEGVALNEIIYDENKQMIDYRILDVNKAYFNTADFTNKVVVGNVATQLYGMSLDHIKTFWEYHKTLKETLHNEYFSPGSQEYFYISTSPIIEDKFLTTFFNITPIKLAEKKLNEKNELLLAAKEKAEESDRLKTAFLQNMSHEIRTPMNAIMGFSELLVRNYNDKSKLEHFSNIINQRCTDLLAIIEDILDIAKIESGQLPVNIEKCNLNSLLGELKLFFSEQQIKLNKKNIKFILQAQCDTEHSIILTDKVKLKQIFINLLSNAFKFTDNGQIEGGCQLDKDNNIIFFVSDTGIGIPAEKQQLIFERFIQISPAPNRLYGGSGLGLAIVKGLVELLGGHIWLESEIGKGSTFYFSLPYKTSNLSELESLAIVEENSEGILYNKTVLVVDDDTYNAAFIKEILSDTGLTILYAQYGNEAIQIATTQPIDLILMDIGLPDITGYEAIRQIKLQKPNLKIIAQTAYAASEDKYKALEAGCADYISKPLKSKLLVSLINKYLS